VSGTHDLTAPERSHVLGFDEHVAAAIDHTLAGFARKVAFESMGAGHARDRSAARHPGMHKRRTVDYAIVLSGEIWALMDEGETLLRAGDVLVQRGINYAWSNRGTAPCRVAFILVSARPA